MITADLHIHTSFCDGKNTPAQMAEAAYKMGLTRLGFSGHSYTPFDTGYCITDEAGYRAEIQRLKAEYAGRMEILCGIEQDIFAPESPQGWDYVIGSAHYVKKYGEYLPVDESPEILISGVEILYEDDFYALCEDYFSTLAKSLTVMRPDIIGHFDLVTKFNQQHSLFDESHPRYITAAFDAVDELVKLGVPFEINTGAISRGYRSLPYPGSAILQRIRERGGRICLSGDAHSVDGICYGFDEAEKLAKSFGFSI